MALQSLHKDKLQHDNGIFREYIIIIINLNSEGLHLVQVN